QLQRVADFVRDLADRPGQRRAVLRVENAVVVVVRVLPVRYAVPVEVGRELEGAHVHGGRAVVIRVLDARSAVVVRGGRGGGVVPDVDDRADRFQVVVRRRSRAVHVLGVDGDAAVDPDVVGVVLGAVDVGRRIPVDVVVPDGGVRAR